MTPKELYEAMVPVFGVLTDKTCELDSKGEHDGLSFEVAVAALQEELPTVMNRLSVDKQALTRKLLSHPRTKELNDMMSDAINEFQDLYLSEDVELFDILDAAAAILHVQ